MAYKNKETRNAHDRNRRAEIKKKFLKLERLEKKISAEKKK